MNLTLPKWQLHLCVLQKTPVRVHFSLIALIPLVLMLSGPLMGDFPSQASFLIVIFGAYFIDAALQAQIATRLQLKVRTILILPLGASTQYIGNVSQIRSSQIRSLGLIPYGLLILAGLSSLDPGSLRLISEVGPSTTTELLVVCSFLILLANLFPLYPQLGKRNVRDMASVKSSLLFNAFLIALSLYMEQYLVSGFFACLLGLSFRRLSEVQALTIASNFQAGQAMIPAERFTCLTHGMLTSQAVNIAARSEQQIFPIYSCAELQGFVSRKALLTATQFDDEETYVREFSSTEFTIVTSNKKLSEILAGLFQGTLHYPIFVIDSDEFVGMLLRDQLIDFLVTQKN